MSAIRLVVLVSAFAAVMLAACTPQQAQRVSAGLVSAQGVFEALQTDPVFRDNQKAQDAFTAILASIRLGQIITLASVVPPGEVLPKATAGREVDLKADQDTSARLAGLWLAQAERERAGR